MKKWIRPETISVSDEIIEKIGGHPLVAETLIRRGVREPSRMLAFLNPDYYHPSSPYELPGMKEAVRRLIRAVKEREKILVWGDFDVDGQTSTTLLVNALKKINAKVKMGSYAWTIAGEKTASGNPIIYSGPQMGFLVPSIVLEGSIQGAGLDISGMSVPGIPGIIIGRTPHHAWSMLVANAHTVDYYLESPDDLVLNRVETIKVKGGDDVELPVYRTSHGPVVNPMPYDPEEVSPTNPVVAWKYSQWGYEFGSIKAFLDLARATSMDEFGAGIELFAVSQHFCYADIDGNIAYWMSGRDPVRPAGEWRLPQGFTGTTLEWNAAVLIPRTTDRNNSQGYYCGWNNKSRPGYDNAYNDSAKYFGMSLFGFGPKNTTMSLKFIFSTISLRLSK